jgi:hypothetical protein
LLRDRGNIKWQGMFLPEHVKALRGYQLELSKKEKPVLDEQQLEIIENTINEAMEFNQTLNIVYFRNGEYELVVGKIHFIDTYQQEIRIVDMFEEVIKVPFKNLIDVKLN